MAKQTTKFEFKNAEVNLDEGLIYEFDKNDETVETYSLKDVLKTLADCGRTDFSINSTTVKQPIEE